MHFVPPQLAQSLQGSQEAVLQNSISLCLRNPTSWIALQANRKGVGDRQLSQNIRLKPRLLVPRPALQGGLHHHPSLGRPQRGETTRLASGFMPFGFTVDNFKLTEANEKVVKKQKQKTPNALIDPKMLWRRVIERFRLRMGLPRAPSGPQTCTLHLWAGTKPQPKG